MGYARASALRKGVAKKMGRGRRPRGAVSKSHKRRKKMSLDTRIKKVLEKQSELKYVDHTISNTPPVAGVSVGSMTVVAQGVALNQRIGNEIRIKKIMLRLNILLSSTTTAVATADAVRIMMIMVKRKPGTILGASDLLSTPSLINDFNNLNNKGGYITLMDKYIPLHAGGGSTVLEEIWGEDMTFLEWFKDLDTPIVYNGADGTLDENTVTGLQLFMISHGARILVTGTCRIRFTDS